MGNKRGTSQHRKGYRLESADVKNLFAALHHLVQFEKERLAYFGHCKASLCCGMSFKVPPLQESSLWHINCPNALLQINKLPSSREMV